MQPTHSGKLPKNGEKVTFEDIQGIKKAFTKKLDEAGDIVVSLVISEHKKCLKNPGLIIRVGAPPSKQSTQSSN